jgi:hypothetical protein
MAVVESISQESSLNTYNVRLAKRRLLVDKAHSPLG